MTEAYRGPDPAFYRKVQRTVAKYGLLERGDRVVVGVSGGPDSVALLSILHEFAGEFDLALHVAHLNHMFRGEEACEDARFVMELAGRFGLPVTVDAFDVPSYIKVTGLSPEEASRRVRYEFFERVLFETRSNKLALGHNADDQVETVIMRFLRGAGLAGLAGIPPLRHGGRTWNFVVIRPLLEVTRREIESYCASIGIKPRTDASNQSPIYLRNRVRLQLLPILEGYNPALRKSLCHMALLMRDEEDYLNGAAGAAFREALLRREDGRLALSIPKLREGHKAIMRRVLRRALSVLCGDPEDFGFEHIEALVELAFCGRTGGKISLPHNILAKKGYNELVIEKKSDHWALPPGVEKTLIVPGVTEVPELGITFETELISPLVGKPWAGRGDVGREEYFDWEAFIEPIVIRTRKKGDRFMPLGMKGMKKLKSFLIDEKVPAEKRDRIPILVSGDGRIAWVVGYRIDERFRVREGTRQVLRVAVRGPGAKTDSGCAI